MSHNVARRQRAFVGVLNIDGNHEALLMRRCSFPVLPMQASHCSTYVVLADKSGACKTGGGQQETKFIRIN